MNSNDLKILRKEIQTEQSVAKENAGQIEKETFGKFQERVYEQVLFLKFGDLMRKQASRANVKGFMPYRIPRLWNVWIEG